MKIWSVVKDRNRAAGGGVRGRLLSQKEAKNRSYSIVALLLL